MLLNLLGAHGKEALVLEAYHRHVRTFQKDNRLTRAEESQEDDLNQADADAVNCLSLETSTASAASLQDVGGVLKDPHHVIGESTITGDALIHRHVVDGREPEPEPEPEPEVEIVADESRSGVETMQNAVLQHLEVTSTTLEPTVSLARHEPGMAPGVIQPPSTDGDGKKLGYVAWDYHARTPEEFGTIFKEQALQCLEQQSVRSSIRCIVPKAFAVIEMDTLFTLIRCLYLYM